MTIDNKLHYKPHPQKEWWKGLEQRITASKKFTRRTDLMTLSEIAERYEKGLIWCDTCINDIPLSDSKITLKDHVLHMVNPSILWSCDNCLIDDYKNGKIQWAENPKEMEWLKEESKKKEIEDLK